MTKTDASKRPVLLIEDNDIEAEAIARGLHKLRVPNPVLRFRNGDAAMQWVKDFSATTAGASGSPAFVILDLNLPDANGREILGALKHHPALRVIPVVVWSGSADPTDIKLCYLDGANSYIQKTVSLEGTHELLETITGYWLKLVSLPLPNELPAHA